MIKKLPAMQETWVQFLGQEDLLEKGMATHFIILTSVLCLENSMDREAWQATVHGVLKQLDTTEKFSFSLFTYQ